MSELNKMFLSPGEVATQLLPIIKSGHVPMIHGSPGIGKSAGVKQLAKDFNKELIDIRLSQYEPTDFSGIPARLDDYRATHLPFDMIPLEGDDLPEGKKGWVLFLDEINHAKPSTAAAVYKLILDRQIGKYNIHPAIDIVAAGNLTTDRALVQVSSTATNSRLVHLYMEPNAREWLEDVAGPRGVDVRVMAFLGEFPEKLMDFDPKIKGVDSFCSPRSWERVSDMLKEISLIEGVDENAPLEEQINAVDLHKYLPAISGSISPGVALEFVSFCEVFQDVVPVATIIANPEGAPLPVSNSATWATLMSLYSHISVDRPEEAANMLKYLNRIESRSFPVLFSQMVFRKSSEFATMEELYEIMSTNQDYIQDETYNDTQDVS